MTPLDEAVERAVHLLALDGDAYLAAVLFAPHFGEPLIAPTQTG